jgi:uncharacterized protein (TIGR02452 family)
MASKSSSSAPFLNKDARAKLGKDTINKLIPQILKSNERARKGARDAELIQYDPKSIPVRSMNPNAGSDASSTSAPLPKIKVIQSDTLDAAQSILSSASKNSSTRVAALNMASSLQPGGGVLKGSRAQEESICLRSTLYASLRREFYRLPETSAVYTPDVLVFRSSNFLAEGDMVKSEQFFIDVISVAALRYPDLKVLEDGSKVYDDEEASTEAMTLKVRLIFQIAKEKGITHLVLGALGCGAYGNPPEEVARIFKRVICGDKKRPGMGGGGIEEIVFAIFDDGENLKVFKSTFEDVMTKD